MKILRHLSQTRNTLFLTLLALVLLARAAIPAGWMPSFAGGAVSISVCTEAGRTTMWLGSDGKVHKADPSRDGHKDSPCTFASLASAADVPLVEVFDFPATPLDVLSSASQTVAVGRGLASPPPPQTGPPALI
jgi:hypothetical protein